MSADKIDIIGVGYGKDVNIGDSYLQESVVNMWDFAPEGAFTYYSKNGSQMILLEYTKTGENTYHTRPLLVDEITEGIKKSLTEKGQQIITN